MHVSITLINAAKELLPSSVRVPKLIFLNITAIRKALSASLLDAGSPGFMANANHRDPII